MDPARVPMPFDVALRITATGDAVSRSVCTMSAGRARAMACL